MRDETLGALTPRLRHRQFWAGYIAALAVTSLIQDFIGRGDYLRMARDGWVTPWITVPLALIALRWAWRNHAR